MLFRLKNLEFMEWCLKMSSAYNPNEELSFASVGLKRSKETSEKYLWIAKEVGKTSAILKRRIESHDYSREDKWRL